MYIYLITNLINNKKYVGQTDDFNRRMNEHKNKNRIDTLIDKKINEYGVENFTFEIIEDNIKTQKELDEKEIYYIKYFNSKVNDWGYNIQDGGKNNMRGEGNTNAHISQEEAQWILNNRNIKQRELYDICEFKNKIGFNQFCAIYNGYSWKFLTTEVEKADNTPKTIGEKCAKANYTNDEIYQIRERYAQGVYYKDVWKEFGCRGHEIAFWKIYNGQGYYETHMDVYTEENRKKHKPDHSGENNGRAKLKKEDVIKIRELVKEGFSDSEINKQFYPQVSKSSITNIRLRRTWKNI